MSEVRIPSHHLDFISSAFFRSYAVVSPATSFPVSKGLLTYTYMLVDE